MKENVFFEIFSSLKDFTQIMIPIVGHEKAVDEAEKIVSKLIEDTIYIGKNEKLEIEN